MPPHILLVEDDPHDVHLTIKALDDPSAYTLTAVEDGVEAIVYLKRREPYTNAPSTQLILLDLKLPKKSSLELLSETKRDAQRCKCCSGQQEGPGQPRDYARSSYSLESSIRSAFR
jgi:CheY-like chemotaxis protein